jgi:primosomal protein N' (replication factor Y)
MGYFIDVILPIPIEKLFTYQVSQTEAEFLKSGMRVAVPFGKSKIYTAIVHHIHNTAPQVYEAKEIHQILDEVPIVTQNQLKLWEWIASYYLCTLGDVMRAALPGAFILESDKQIRLNSKVQVDEHELRDGEFLVYEALQHQSSLSIHEIASIIERKNALPVINRLINKQLVNLQEELYEKYIPKMVRFVKLHHKYTSESALQDLVNGMSRAPNQQEVLLTLFTLSAQTKKPIKVSQLVAQSNTSSAIVKALIDKDILEEYHLQQDRVVYENVSSKRVTQLNTIQENALKTINNAFKDDKVSLLHGITSSGKTEVYVKLIEQNIKEGKQVLYLLPEIALTTQLVSRLQQYFGEQVAIYHSKYSVHERVEVWYNMLNNISKAKIILGARSALFLPFTNLGLVLVDEEHEQSFKQFDPAPRYHARDAAIVLAQFFNANVLLGSATPSVESYYNALNGKYALAEMHERYNSVLLPEIELVDIKTKHKKKLMNGHFSDVLISEMTQALAEGFQIILFQNRRGFSPIIECVTCGHSPQCPNCDVSLTYHQYKNELRCHYCGHHIAMQQQCMACGSHELDSKGFGTEQVEEEVKALFPDAKVARMDSDTTRGKYAYEKLITAFEQEEIDILIGTQMLSKGLDFRNVKLVGVMNADTMLNFPDFRAHERSFQLIQQVAGRAGRTDVRGKVLVQTYNPYHTILQQVSVNDYQGMYKDQLNERYQYKYPPIYRLIKITLKHKDYNKVYVASTWYAKSLRQYFGEYVLGPEFPPIARIRNQYHKNILIKIPQKQSLPKTKEAIVKVNNSFKSIKDFNSVKVILNVDTY